MKNTSSRILFIGVALVFAASITTTFTACTAKRAEVFTQGQGTNLDTVVAWKERMVPLSTGDVIGAVASTHAEDAVKVASNVKSMNHYDLVQMKLTDSSLAGLVGNPPFRGKPNTTGVYELKIKLTNNYLKFYKVALPENIPFDERAYAEETLSDGRMVVPMLGYKISGYFRVEPVKTNDDLDSHHLTEIAEPDPTKATHLRIDWNSRELFETVKTMDLIPSQIFFASDKANHGFKPYEWYYSETVTEKSISDTKTIVGEKPTHNEESALVPASKVVIIPGETELRVVNVARDERLNRDQGKKNEDVNSEATLIIPVKWTDLRTKTEGVNLSLHGESVEDRSWDQRALLELDLQKITSAGITDGTTQLLDLEVDQNYFSFSVLNMVGSKGRKIHYSFLRADQGRAPYSPKLSFKNDRNLFGFFTSEKPFIANWEYYTEGDFNKRIFMSRMNPDQKEIVFHLSVGSPAWLEDIAERAVSAWDKTFEQAMKETGKTIKVRFDKDRVQLGDLRYNVIHMVETLNEDGLLGFGPSVADPETGEIISATTNVYVNSTKAIAASTIRQFMIDRLEKRLERGTISIDPVTAPVLNVAASKVVEAKKSGSTFGKTSIEEFQKGLKKNSKDQCQFAEHAMMNANDTDILNYCPEIEKVIEQHASLDFMSRGVSDANWEKVWLDSKPAILECATKITRGKLLSTIIHEMGHNFGLRHNFYGSYDKQNFKSVTSIFGEKIVAHSSSIMEYTDWAEDRLTETGPYDVAAIRFGYGEQVETNDGKIVSIDQTKSLDNKSLKPYLFCSDEVAYTGLSAFCKTDDAGTNPKEVVQFYIDRYKRTEALRKLRRVRRVSADPEAVASYNLTQTFLPLKDIYDEWRYQLGEYVRKSQRYLSDYSSKDYAQVLDAMSKDPQFGPIYAQYHDAADQIYDFFKEVAFGPNQYCLIEDGGEKRAIELERLRDLLSEATRGAVAIRTCVDAAAASEFAQVLDAHAPKVLSEIGYPINSYKFEKPETYEDNLRDDVIGNAQTRAFAGLLIHHRMDNLRNEINQFAPNMTDEPTHYVDFAQTLMSRLIDGADLTAFGVTEAQPLFSQEASLLTDLAGTFKVGLYTPGDRLSEINQVVTRQKLAPFFVYRPDQSDDGSKFAAVLSMNDRTLFAAIKKTHVFAYNLISRFNEIDGMLGMSEVSPAIQTQINDLLMKVIPSSADLPNKTVEDFIGAVQALGKVEDAYASFATCVEKNTPMLAQVGEVLPSVVEDYQAAHKAGDEEEKKFMAINLVDYMKTKLNGKELIFTQENLQPLAGVMSSCATDLSASVRKVNRNRKDYEAQKSMILDVLSAYAN